MSHSTDKRLVLLHEDDNILVCCRRIAAGEVIRLNGQPQAIHSDIDVGHKLARVDIDITDKIYKYGAAIGSAKATIRRGDHVHLHNLKSDYMPSYQRSGLVDDSLNIPTTGDNP